MPMQFVRDILQDGLYNMSLLLLFLSTIAPATKIVNAQPKEKVLYKSRKGTTRLKKYKR